MIIKKHYSLLQHNTFKINVLCNDFVQLFTNDEVVEFVNSFPFPSPFFVLGGGSNVLFTEDFNGTIVQVATKGIDIVEDNDDFVIVGVAAGEKWENFVDFAVNHHYYGIENLVGIPGNVGSCPVQNIGAYGVEVKDAILSVEGIDLLSKKSFSLSNSQCHFGYRDSIFKNELKNRCIITKVLFKLSKREHYHTTYSSLKSVFDSNDETLSLQAITKEILRIRNSKLPDINILGCAGSFFRNPVVAKTVFENLKNQYPQLICFDEGENVKMAAGQLIELSGWKGKRVGNVGIYDKQALVIVNYADATGKEVEDFYKKIQYAVFQKFGISLLTEVIIL